jgi:hypothetical protein
MFKTHWVKVVKQVLQPFWKKSSYLYKIWQKIWCAKRVRVNFPHIANWWISCFVQKNPQEISKTLKIWKLCSKTFIVKHVRAKFQLSNFYLEGQRISFDIFSRKFQNSRISEVVSNRHFLPEIEPSNIFTKFSKVILLFLAPEFALEISKFQNSVQISKGSRKTLDFLQLSRSF